MKKLCVIVGLCFLLSGCAAAETFETLGQIQHQQNVAPVMGTVQLSLPQSAQAETLSNGTDTLYDCDGYSLMLQTLQSGDLSRTVKTLSGFSIEKVMVVESKAGENMRYEWVWTAAGEGGDVLCRATVLDDGNYHYCLCAMSAAEKAGSLQTVWSELFQSFTLS